jgi:hypothetical protein
MIDIFQQIWDADQASAGVQPIIDTMTGDPQTGFVTLCPPSVANAKLLILDAASHDAGKAVFLDLVYNHFVESPLQAIARDLYTDGETKWGDMVNYDHPIVREFFRQALVYQWFVIASMGSGLTAPRPLWMTTKDTGA